MTAKEIFEELGYEQTTNSNNSIEYRDDSHGDGSYAYIIFNHMWKEYEVGYYDGRKALVGVSVKEHEAITKQMKELGWI